MYLVFENIQSSNFRFQAQNFLIAIIIAAIFDFVIGTIIGPKYPLQQAQGFLGFSCTLNFTL